LFSRLDAWSPIDYGLPMEQPAAEGPADDAARTPQAGGLPPLRTGKLPERAAHLRHETLAGQSVRADPQRAIKRGGRRSHVPQPRRLQSLAPVWWTAAVVVLLVATNWYSSRFFYSSGLNAGMQRGLEARTEARLASGSDGAAGGRVFAALVTLREADPGQAEAELIATLVLRELRRLPEDQLPDTLRPGHNAAEDFAAAYVAMRLGDFGKATAILRETEPGMPPEMFEYLMNDPAMREFAREPRVMGFY
jgi:hypothetical protein